MTTLKKAPTKGAMAKLTTLLLAPLLATLLVCAPSIGEEDKFAKTYEAFAKDKEKKVSEEAAKHAKTLHFVIFGGYKGEDLAKAGYLKTLTKSLEMIGVPKEQVHRLYPPSNKWPQENAEGFIKEKLEEVAKDAGDKQIVVIGHSKGALEMMIFAKDNPDFVSEHVAKLISVQGALQQRGLRGFNPDPEGEDKDALNSIAEKVLFITSTVSSDEVPAALKVVARTEGIDFTGIKNDGHLALSVMTWTHPRMEKVLLEGWDHFELVPSLQFGGGESVDTSKWKNLFLARTIVEFIAPEEEEEEQDEEEADADKDAEDDDNSSSEDEGQSLTHFGEQQFQVRWFLSVLKTDENANGITQQELG